MRFTLLLVAPPKTALSFALAQCCKNEKAPVKAGAFEKLGINGKAACVSGCTLPKEVVFLDQIV